MLDKYLRTMAEQLAHCLWAKMPACLAQRALGRWAAQRCLERVIEEGVKLALQTRTRRVEQEGDNVRERKATGAGKVRRFLSCLLGKGLRTKVLANGAKYGTGFAMSWSSLRSHCNDMILTQHAVLM